MNTETTKSICEYFFLTVLYIAGMSLIILGEIMSINKPLCETVGMERQSLHYDVKTKTFKIVCYLR